MTNKVGIIVPYRDRPDQLAYFLAGTQQYLHSNGIDHEIIIVEQDFASEFNRGMLCNIGFTVAKKRRCSHVVFHDVDMLPGNIDYSYSPHPVHMVSDDLPFRTYFGGITLFPNKDFKKINGFSNFYWGWGFEDDDLRYRCIKGNLKLKKEEVQAKFADKQTVILNGESAYIKIDNPINHLRNFEINIDIRTDKLIYDHTKDSDKYTIFSLPGEAFGGQYYEFTLFYSSFKRFSLQCFDKEGEFYQIYSEPIDLVENNIIVDYNHRKKTISLYIDGNLIGSIVLKERLFEYVKSKTLFIGADYQLNNFFKDAIDTFSVKGNLGKAIVDLKSDTVKHYKIVDQSGNGNPGKISKAELGVFNTPDTYIEYLPIRRKSRITKLSHESSGFIGGRWKSDLTRWSQLRFNNEVINGRYEGVEDGLSTCEYILHSKEKKDNIIHLKVGI